MFNPLHLRAADSAQSAGCFYCSLVPDAYLSSHGLTPSKGMGLLMK
jgi:hypothetical protein